MVTGLNTSQRKGNGTIGKRNKKYFQDKIRKSAEKAAKREGNVPSTMTTQTAPPVTPPAKTTKRLFVYGPLNIHDVQRVIWGEAKEGESGNLRGFEERAFADESMGSYLEPKPGEYVVGKVYELTPEQLEATDIYMTDAYKRSVIPKENYTDEDVFVYLGVKGDKVEKDSNVKD